MTDKAQVQEFYEQILRAHWDMAACYCPVCFVGRALGFRPRDIEIRPEIQTFAEQLHPFMDTARPVAAWMLGRQHSD